MIVLALASPLICAAVSHLALLRPSGLRRAIIDPAAVIIHILAVEGLLESRWTGAFGTGAERRADGRE